MTGTPSPAPERLVEVTIDDRPVRVGVGGTILDACRQFEISVPTLCFLPGFEPPGACRLCVVEVDGARTLAPSCIRSVEPGMIVRTQTERVRESRRVLLELLGSSVDLGLAPDLLDELRALGARPERFAGSGEIATVEQPPLLDNDLYIRDYARCVHCYRCVQACGDDAQHTFAIAVAGRGFDARISTEHGVPLPDSACVFCGNCIDVCPTDALMTRTEFDLRRLGDWDETRQEHTDTICSYCGVGCTLTLQVQDGAIVNVASPIGHEVARGQLCIKGRFGWRFVQGANPRA